MLLPEPRGLCSFRPCVNYAPCGAAFTWLLWVFSIVGLGLTTYCMVRLRGPGSSPLAQIGMVDFVPGHAVIQAAQRKRVKYEAKCADIVGYGFLSFSFSSFGELEQDACLETSRAQLALGSLRLVLGCWGVGMSEGGEAILYAVNLLIEDHGDDVGLSMLLV
ncbi:hypothetical protein Tco_1489756, partial [Tanacetum coccineum]